MTKSHSHWRMAFLFKVTTHRAVYTEVKTLLMQGGIRISSLRFQRPCGKAASGGLHPERDIRIPLITCRFQYAMYHELSRKLKSVYADIQILYFTEDSQCLRHNR